MDNNKKPQYFTLAQILKPQGIKGEVKLKPFVDDLSRFDELAFVYIKKSGEYIKREVQSERTYKHFAYVKLEGCDDRNTAETLRNMMLYIDRENAAPLDDGAHYIADLEGCSVVTTEGTVLGELVEVISTGATDVYSVKGEKSFMFPAAPHVILKKDVDNRCITVDSESLEQMAVYD